MRFSWATCCRLDKSQAPARQAARGAKLPDATGATTVNKVCGSGCEGRSCPPHAVYPCRPRASIVLSGGMEEHEQCALSGAQGARRLPRRP